MFCNGIVSATNSAANSASKKMILRAHAVRNARNMIGEHVRVKGWVRTVRKQKNVSFLEINDGSSVKGCQVVAPTNLVANLDGLSVGCSVSVQGLVAKGPESHGEMEIHIREDGVQAISVIGAVDQQSFPLQKKYQSLEFLRDHLHLRARTNTAGAVLRVRHRVSSAVRQYLDHNDFIEVNTPIITGNDCEGAGELFEVRCDRTNDPNEQKSSFVSNNVPNENIIGEEDADKYFKVPAFLTVSGQMHAEALACSMGRVYTFGPTFRAENSHTSRHLSEFWMIEPEIAFATMDDAIDIAQGTIKFVFQSVIEQNKEDIQFFGNQLVMAQRRREKGHAHNAKENAEPKSTGVRLPIETLRILSDGEKSFSRMTYTEAVEALQKSNLPASQVPTWGEDLSSNQERWLVEKHCEYTPLIVTDYPSSIKPFYMRQNDDGKTVAAFDILLPGVGEVVGGSAREERLDLLEIAMQKQNIQGLEWYADLRRHGTVPHAGFGIGMERLVMACTGVANVRDVVPFPRTSGSCSL